MENLKEFSEFFNESLVDKTSELYGSFRELQFASKYNNIKGFRVEKKKVSGNDIYGVTVSFGGNGSSVEMYVTCLKWKKYSHSGYDENTFEIRFPDESSINIDYVIAELDRQLPPDMQWAKDMFSAETRNDKVTSKKEQFKKELYDNIVNLFKAFDLTWAYANKCVLKWIEAYKITGVQFEVIPERRISLETSKYLVRVQQNNTNRFNYIGDINKQEFTDKVNSLNLNEGIGWDDDEEVCVAYNSEYFAYCDRETGVIFEKLNIK